MPGETDKNHPVPAAVDLQAAVTSLVQSVLAARAALDQETAELALLYQKHELLRQFPPPAFGIQEVTLRLPYAAVDLTKTPDRRPVVPGDLPHLLVQINGDVIARLPPHAVGQVEFKLTQESISLLLGEQKPE